MGAPELVIPELVVVDTRDGFIFWQDDAGRFFTEETVGRFLEERSPVCVLRKLAHVEPVQAELDLRPRCATVGCKAKATKRITYTQLGVPGQDDVCDPCADGYLRRPALRASARSL